MVFNITECNLRDILGKALCPKIRIDGITKIEDNDTIKVTPMYKRRNRNGSVILFLNVNPSVTIKLSNRVMEKTDILMTSNWRNILLNQFFPVFLNIS